MERKGWYLVAYDITNPKRLQRIHRMLKKQGIAAQKSLFFVRGTESILNSVLDGIASVMEASEDDLRAYPIIDPSEVWAFGPNPLADYPVVDFEKQDKAPSQHKTGIWERLFRIFGKR